LVDDSFLAGVAGRCGCERNSRGVVGSVVALNLMILSGVDSGYEASIAQVFDHRLLFGVLVVVALVAGPVLGVIAAGTLRRRLRPG
jgi:hypothetical protein